jgi:hypothetical protein
MSWVCIVAFIIAILCIVLTLRSEEFERMMNPDPVSMETDERGSTMFYLCMAYFFMLIFVISLIAVMAKTRVL